MADPFRVTHRLWFNHGRAAHEAARPSFLANPFPRTTVTATATLRIDPTGPDARMPLSIAASLAIHVAALVLIGAILRSMPATVIQHERGLPSLTADLITLPALSEEPQALLPPLAPADTIRPMLPVPVSPPSRATPAPGLSSAPATIQVNADLAPVGRISYRFGNGAPLFGADLAPRMAARYPAKPARLPRVEGSMSVLYPVKAAAQGRSQTLSALLSIDAEGHVVEVRVLPDDSMFVVAVMAALKNARFSPATEDGKPIPYWAVLDFSFKIDGPTAADGRRLDR